MYIVQGEQADAEYLVAHEEMPNVRAAETTAGDTLTALVERQGVVPVLGPLDVETAGAREDGSVSPHARRGDAVEHVDSASDALDQISGKPDAHEVARACAGKGFVDDVEHLVHRRLFLADRKPADCEPVPVVHRRESGGGFFSKKGVDASLDNGEQRLWLGIAVIEGLRDASVIAPLTARGFAEFRETTR